MMTKFFVSGQRSFTRFHAFPRVVPRVSLTIPYPAFISFFAFIITIISFFVLIIANAIVSFYLAFFISLFTFEHEIRIRYRLGHGKVHKCSIVSNDIAKIARLAIFIGNLFRVKFHLELL